jgi:hypothetical protein
MTPTGHTELGEPRPARTRIASMMDLPAGSPDELVELTGLGLREVERTVAGAGALARGRSIIAGRAGTG